MNSDDVLARAARALAVIAVIFAAAGVVGGLLGARLAFWLAGW